MNTLLKTLFGFLFFTAPLSLSALHEHEHAKFIRKVIEEAEETSINAALNLIEQGLSHESQHEYQENLRWLKKTMELFQKNRIPFSISNIENQTISLWYCLKSGMSKTANIFIRPCLWMVPPLAATILAELANEDVDKGKRGFLFNLLFHYHKSEARQWTERNVPGAPYIPGSLKDQLSHAYGEARVENDGEQFKNTIKTVSVIGVPALFIVCAIFALRSFIYHGKKLSEFRHDINHLKKHFSKPAASRINTLLTSHC